jgi:hypothetical protein
LQNFRFSVRNACLTFYSQESCFSLCEDGTSSEEEEEEEREEGDQKQEEWSDLFIRPV